MSPIRCDPVNCPGPWPSPLSHDHPLLPRTGAGRILSEKLLKLHQMLSGWYCGHVLETSVRIHTPGPFLGAMSTLKREHAVSLALCSVLPTDGLCVAQPERMAQLTHSKLLRAQPQG